MTDIADRETSLLNLVLENLGKGAAPKSLRGQPGWLFLKNDTNRFLSYLFGADQWSPAESQQAALRMQQRAAWLRDKGARYFRFAVPEKSAVYNDFLPAPLDRLPLSAERPARFLDVACPEAFFYLEQPLREARRIQHTYFRCDSHTNWFGAFTLYRAITDVLLRRGLIDPGTILSLRHLLPSFAAYNGDLLPNLPPGDLAAFEAENAPFATDYGAESLMLYKVHPHRARAQSAPMPDDYAAWFTPRPQIRTLVPDASLPKAVIFRDSTADLVWPLLAEHFSEAIFIWHKGRIFREVVERERPDVVLHIQAERFLQTDPVREPTYSVLDA